MFVRNNGGGHHDKKESAADKAQPKKGEGTDAKKASPGSTRSPKSDKRS
jgi:hypothetical protein